MGSFIEFKDVKKIYKMGEVEIPALAGVDFQIEKGEFVVIAGASGAGKSTILNILGGMDSPTSGEIIVDGAKISDFNAKELTTYRRYDIGFVFQFYNLIPNLNVEENVMLPLLLDGKKMKDYRSRLDEIIETVGLTERKKYTPRELSGGQQQRVAIARALIGNPEILFADEPTGNLDSKTGGEIMELLHSINKHTGQTIIMVTHSAEAAERSGHIITIRDGVRCVD